MGIFDDDFGGEKQCVLQHMLKTAPIHILEQVLMNEDCIIGGYEKAFPNKIAFKYEDFLAEKARREGQ